MNESADVCEIYYHVFYRLLHVVYCHFIEANIDQQYYKWAK